MSENKETKTRPPDECAESTGNGEVPTGGGRWRKEPFDCGNQEDKWIHDEKRYRDNPRKDASGWLGGITPDVEKAQEVVRDEIVGDSKGRADRDGYCCSYLHLVSQR